MDEKDCCLNYLINKSVTKVLKIGGVGPVDNRPSTKKDVGLIHLCGSVILWRVCYQWSLPRLVYTEFVHFHYDFVIHNLPNKVKIIHLVWFIVCL